MNAKVTFKIEAADVVVGRDLSAPFFPLPVCVSQDVWNLCNGGGRTSRDVLTELRMLMACASAARHPWTAAGMPFTHCFLPADPWLFDAVEAALILSRKGCGVAERFIITLDKEASA